MADDSFRQSADAVVATLLELFLHQGQAPIVEILASSKPRIERTDYDNWDGGTYIFTLFLEVPVKLFADIEPKLKQVENAIEAKLASILRYPGNQQLRSVTISPVLEQPTTATIATVPGTDVTRLWDEGMLRLFMSHVAAHRVPVSKLKSELIMFGVSAFVAHEDIEPNLEWQREIELALRSMHALLAVLTPEFRQSRWTDQEVGFALGRGVLVIPVRAGLDPYGFIGRQQALSAKLESPQDLASGVVDVLLRHRTTAPMMRESLVVALEKSWSFAASKTLAPKIEAVDFFTSNQLDRLEAACKNNGQVVDAFGVPERIRRLIQRFRPQPTEDVPF